MAESRSTPEWLDSLNPEQREAVCHTGGNLLILAGAGSGKTRVITSKIAWLIRERGMSPESILAVTFTNKAAREMQERAALIEPLSLRTNIKTFHSFGAWFLRRNAQALDLNPNFTIYDDDDSLTLVKAVRKDMPRPEAARMARAIARAKDYGLEPGAGDMDEKFRNIHGFEETFAEYEKRLRATGNVDFGDLINLPAKILEEDETIRERTRSRFQVILVDEYQDSNIAQFRLLKALAGPDTYICVVGDDDQSIYKFRGAEVNNILEFENAFPNTRIIRLEKNYRSYQSILDIASSVVANNEGRLGKNLLATRSGGDKPVLAVLSSGDEEGAYCARVIDAAVRRGSSFSEIAILYRTNAQSLAFERALPQMGIPYRLVGSVRFYEREEVKDALALLALAANPKDEVAFRRVINKPARGIGEAGMEAIILNAWNRDGNLITASKDTGLKTKKAREGAEFFASLMVSLGQRLDMGNAENHKDGSLNAESLAEIIDAAVRDSGLYEYHKNQDEIAGSQKIANIDELQNAGADYPGNREGLIQFLEAIELDIALLNQEESTDAVTLITMHNTKGLEFPIVIITGMEQGLFPRDNEEGEDLEEQRRLFYVALTRAKDELHLTYCKSRYFRGMLKDYPPSSFLGEIPARMLKSFGGKLNLDRVAEMGKWKRGMLVYHDDHGYGQVIKVNANDTELAVMVRFETGRVLQFLPAYTGKLQVIKD